MFSKLCKGVYRSRIGLQQCVAIRNDLSIAGKPSYSKVAVAVKPAHTSLFGKSEVNLDKVLCSSPCSLALAKNSPWRFIEPKHGRIRRFILTLLLYYSKMSKQIRAANAIHSRICWQVDKPAIYKVFSLERTFTTTFSLLVLHMWLCLRRLQQEGDEAANISQYLYEKYNHDLEMRVSEAGVKLMLNKSMKQLEKIFYGNVVAYDKAMLPEARLDEMNEVLWRNIFCDGGSSIIPERAAERAVQALSRYVRREANCMSLTDKVDVLSGNFMFTPLEGSFRATPKTSNA